MICDANVSLAALILPKSPEYPCFNRPIPPLAKAYK
jgi:hypothetical protein